MGVSRQLRAHSLLPITNPHEAVAALTRARLPNTCTHNLSECDCVAQTPGLRGLVMHEVIQEYTPLEVLEYCTRNRIYCGAYSILLADGDAGESCNGEVSWSRSGGLETIQRRGGTTSRNPTPHQWRSTGHVTKGDHTLAWTPGSKIGEHQQIFQFSVGNYHMHDNDPNSMSYMLPNGEEATITTSGNECTLHMPGRAPISAPSEVVDNLTARALNGEPTATWRNLVVNKARGYVGKTVGGSRITTTIALNAAQIGMVLATHEEIVCRQRLEQFSELWDKSEEHAAFNRAPPRPSSICTRLAEGVKRLVCRRSALVAGLFVPKPVQAQGSPETRNPAAFWVCVFILLGAIACCVMILRCEDVEATHQVPSNTDTIQWLQSYGTLDNHPAMRRAQQERSGWPSTVFKTDSNLDTSDLGPAQALVEISEDDQSLPPRPYGYHVVEPPTTLRDDECDGVACIANLNSNHNIALAMQTRVASAARPIPDELVARHFRRWVSRHVKDYFKPGTKCSSFSSEERDQEFEAWVTRYNVNKRTNLRKAKELIDAGDQRGMHIKEIFIKSEPSHNKCDDEQGNVSKPRVIVKNSDKYLALVGPRIATMQRRIVRAARANIKIGCKRMESYADALSKWVRTAQDTANKLNDDRNREYERAYGAPPPQHRLQAWHVYVIENDLTNYDSTNDYMKSRMYVDVYRDYGMDAETLKHMDPTMKVKDARNRDGSRFKWDGTMGSGEPDTWLRNTVGNVLHSHYGVHIIAGHSDIRAVGGAFSGDDSFMVVVAMASTELIQRSFTKTHADLGYISKTIVHEMHLNDAGRQPTVGFCSHEFVWYGNAFKMLPQMARVLHRVTLARAHTEPDSTVAANVYGQWNRLSHTPLIRAYTSALYQRFNGTNTSVASRFTFDYDSAAFDIRQPPPPLSLEQYDHLSSVGVTPAEADRWERLAPTYVNGEITNTEERFFRDVAKRL